MFIDCAIDCSYLIEKQIIEQIHLEFKKKEANKNSNFSIAITSLTQVFPYCNNEKLTHFP